MRRFLVTTALEETWSDHEPVLFLGEWCRLHGRKKRWAEMNATMLPYHWDNRAKLYADYLYLQEFHERLLTDLTKRLNQIHDVNHGLRYWRILVGPWLGYFTQMLFDRWSSIQQAISQYDLSGTIILTGPEESLVPNDMSEFYRLFIGDEWNHYLYACILKQFTDLPYSERARQGLAGGEKAVPAPVDWKQRVRKTLARYYGRVANGLTGDRDCFFLDIDLPFSDVMRLHWRFRQVPQWWRSVSPTRVTVEWGQRQWVVPGNNNNAFEACVRALIPRQIPTTYLEGYGQLVEKTVKLPWPKQPKLIWTNNSFNSDEVFKAWAAEKAAHGSALVAGQHGGFYGVGRWSFNEDHEIAVSDCYMSWGWSEPEQPKVKPVGELKAKRPLGIRHMDQRGAILVTCIVPRQSYWMFSFLVSSQWLNYFKDQCVFVQSLPASIRTALTVRLHSKDYEWSQADRWREHFPDLKLDEGQSDINELIRRSRLYISTYNATTYLESFTMDVPTVIYWDPKYWELRKTAIPFFEDLKRVGIFHETPESAARHVATIWDDVGAWWNSPSVREALERFKQRYCHLPNDLLDRVEATLSEVIAASDNLKANPGPFAQPP